MLNPCTSVTKCVLQDFPEDKKIGSTSFEFVEGDPANRELLQKSGVAFADSIVIGGILDGRPAKEADALTITLVMLVQECLAAAGRDDSNPAHIVGMVCIALMSDSRMLAQHAFHICQDSPIAGISCIPLISNT